MTDGSSQIFDIGMSEGNDTAFYLAKGFSVAGVEADPTTYKHLIKRFEPEIQQGRLRLINKAAHSNSGELKQFWINSVQAHSSIYPNRGKGEKVPADVETTNWVALTSLFGIPYYLKMDIEGAEKDFLASMLGCDIPKLISAECHTFDVIAALYALGYRKFKLINQTTVTSIPIPNPPLEGNYVPKPNWTYASGPFGRELPGEWYNFQTIAHQFKMVEELKNAGGMMQPWAWFDCHARLG
jgi:FkbM family methyltransferase